MKIEKITIKHEIDEYPDTSHLGSFSSKPTETAIHHPSGEFVYRTEKGARIISALDDIIYDEDEKEEYIAMCETRRDRILAWYDEATRTERNTHPYFIPYACGLSTKDPEFKQCATDDYGRMQGLHVGAWHYIRVVVTAHIAVEYGENGVAYDEIATSLCGIESDAGEYIKEVEKEQLGEVKSELLKRGFIPAEVDTALEDVERIN